MLSPRTYTVFCSAHDRHNNSSGVLKIVLIVKTPIVIFPTRLTHRTDPPPK